MNEANIAASEQRYQTLLRDFQAGKIGEAAFMSAVDGLGFRDDRGRYWMVGTQTGDWYYYDEQGQTWRQADPRREALVGEAHGRGAAPARSGQRRRRPTFPSPANRTFGTLLTMALAVALFAAVVVLSALPVSSAPSSLGPVAVPSPRPTLDSDGGGSGGGDGGGEGMEGAIVGKVTDLSTGQAPGRAVEVLINESTVTTDPEGRYSLTGLEAGQYTVTLVLRGEERAAQAPVVVSVDGRSTVTVDLDYYSQPQPVPTDTPPAVAIAATPVPELPEAGAPTRHNSPLVVATLGLVLTLLGGALRLSVEQP